MQGKKLYLSASGIQTFMLCKKKFKLKYIDKYDCGVGASSKYISFGNSIHAAIAQYHMLTDVQYKSLEVLRSLLQKNWIRQGYVSIEEEKEFAKRGMDMLSNYFIAGLDIGVSNHVIEEMLNIDLGEFILCGKLDRVYEREDGLTEVLDYKTGSNAETIDNIQLAVYTMLAKKKLGYCPDVVSLYFLPIGKKEDQSVDTDGVGSTERFITDIYNQIVSEKVFEPSPSPLCKNTCQYSAICKEAKDENKAIIHTLINQRMDKAIENVFSLN